MLHRKRCPKYTNITVGLKNCVSRCPKYTSITMGLINCVSRCPRHTSFTIGLIICVKEVSKIYQVYHRIDELCLKVHKVYQYEKGVQNNPVLP